LLSNLFLGEDVDRFLAVSGGVFGAHKFRLADD
jgi:hypothetical protein